VFEPFYRGGAAGDDAQHLGLGLFLVRSHVESLRGQCRIESTIGQGTTMHITLPEAGAPSPAHQPPTEPPPPAAMQPAETSKA
jgi:signal transduction histidine kinase